ncbi:MAG: hypothetical protein KZQ84_19945 [Candidatus Thiodiazotropha sp. (ex Lucinoma borealis)]|nr:hypothetical protein [Candidatus Thiodiazotropha sp. (ex Lucinoma borealis)]
MSITMIKNITKIIEIAEIYPASALPSGMHQAYPIPILEGREMLFAFMYASTVTNEPGCLELYPPSYIAYIEAATGKFKQLIATKPSDYGLNDDIHKPLGTFTSRPLRQDEKYMNTEALLYQGYDLLLPEYMAGNITVEQSLKNEALEYLARFKEIGEPPLSQYYENLGKHFFNWLHAVSS